MTTPDRARRFRLRLAAGAAMLCAAAPVLGQGVGPLVAGFRSPPAESRPRLWWHWMNGNITQAGIAKDLAWMQRIGAGGVQAFNASLQTPAIVPPVKYMTPAWKDAMRFAAGEADRLGLELAIASSPGFSATGAPFVAEHDAIKKFVWSEVTVEGGRAMRLALPPLPDAIGPYQAMPGAGQVGQPGRKPVPTSGDVAVIAYRVPAVASLPPAAATALSGEPLDAAVLRDDFYRDTARVPAGTADAPGGVVLTYERAQTVRSATMHVPGKSDLIDLPLAPRLEASTDGRTWRKVADMPVGQVPTTVSFAPVTARYFRLILQPDERTKPSYADPAPGVAGAERLALRVPPAKTIRVAEFSLSAEPRIDRFESKAGFAVEADYAALSPSGLPAAAGIDPAGVVDLTTRLAADGTLTWTPPAGRWRVLRFGWSLTGKANHPAAPEATGLEVDKLDGDAVRRYIDTYLDGYAAAVGPDLIGRRGIRALLNDSLESGAANWTPRMVAQFRRLRGYDPTPWLPAMTGAIVGDRARSDAFLADYRRTLSDLIASEHYGTIAAAARKRGLVSYAESMEGLSTTIGDDIAMRRYADVPMAALWTYARRTGPKPAYLVDIKGAASIAHVEGRPRVAAEMFTAMLAPWAYAPADLRPVADLAFANGINLPIIHTSVHQPLDAAPGLPFFIIGQYFTRLESWADMADAWIGYLARTGYLLQQGHDVADVGYVYGDGASAAGLFGETGVRDAPSRHAYDLLDSASLRDRTRVEDGMVAMAGGARYRLLYLGSRPQPLTLATLRRLDVLVGQGATLAGLPPLPSPGLADDAAEHRRIVARLWGGGPVTQAGKGRVIATGDVDVALAMLGVTPDFASGVAPADVLYAHRRVEGGDIYFVTNRTDRPLRLDAGFRVTGKAAEIWRADTGTMTPAAYAIGAETTRVPLEMAAGDSFFVT
ncbi:MAG: glycosyl hydrolase, partial [Sphingobium sp.]